MHHVFRHIFVAAIARAGIAWYGGVDATGWRRLRFSSPLRHEASDPLSAWPISQGCENTMEAGCQHLPSEVPLSEVYILNNLIACSYINLRL